MEVDDRWDYRTSREFVQRKRYSIDIPDWARFSLEVPILLEWMVILAISTSSWGTFTNTTSRRTTTSFSKTESRRSIRRRNQCRNIQARITSLVIPQLMTSLKRTGMHHDLLWHHSRLQIKMVWSMTNLNLFTLDTLRISQLRKMKSWWILFPGDDNSKQTECSLCVTPADGYYLQK